jgi:Flp pilus assembly protein TadG
MMTSMVREGRLSAVGRCMVRGGGRLREQAGQAVVEFAILIFPLVLIVFGILDFGRALNYYNDLTQLAGQGARAAAVNQNPNGGVASSGFQAELAGNADAPELKSPAVKVCVSAPQGWPPKTGDPIKVVTSHDFHFIPIIHSATISLSSSQTLRFESVSPSFTQGGPGC